MVGYKAHLIFGFFTAIITIIILNFVNGLNLNNPNLLFTLFITTLIFSLLPDVDHKKSYISRFLQFSVGMVILLFVTKIIHFNLNMIILFISLILLEIYSTLNEIWNLIHLAFVYTNEKFTKILFVQYISYIICNRWKES